MNGTQIALRTASGADAQALAGLLAGLSPASGFHRFLTGLGRPTPAQVRALLATEAGRGAWLALDGDEAVGHACWSVDGGVADIGVVVTDAWQGCGLGRRLIVAAVLSAVTAGATRLHLDVHPDNRRVVRILRSRLPAGGLAYLDGLVQADVPVGVVLGPAYAESAARIRARRSSSGTAAARSDLSLMVPRPE